VKAARTVTTGGMEKHRLAVRSVPTHCGRAGSAVACPSAVQSNIGGDFARPPLNSVRSAALGDAVGHGPPFNAQHLQSIAKTLADTESELN
jgi:hypothetical protein